jgi:hypothetical protein
MKKIILLLAWIVMACSVRAVAQDARPAEKIEVLTLGVFHFAYPNLDVQKTAKEDQINVLEDPWQKEIQAIALALKEFRPTIIAVEADSTEQAGLDSLYRAYLRGEHSLQKSEIEQLGFRLAKASNLSGVRWTNDWGKHYQHLSFIFNDTLPETRDFARYIQNNPDSIYNTGGIPQEKAVGITDFLIQRNNPDHIRQRLGAYLTGAFKYERKPGDFTGVDFETGRWFNRNLRIFRNVQRLGATPRDRILLIYGADHLNLLNIFFEASPEYKLISPLPYLEKAKQELKAYSNSEQSSEG